MSAEAFRPRQNFYDGLMMIKEHTYDRLQAVLVNLVSVGSAQVRHEHNRGSTWKRANEIR